MCKLCNKVIDFQKTLDLRAKENIKKINFIFNEPETQLKKVIETFKFQKMHQKKYISFLENKIENLLQENTTLKQNLKAAVNSNTTLNNSINLSASNNENVSYSAINSNNNAYIDLSKIKKIEPKQRIMKQSNKMYAQQLTTPIDMVKQNVVNLNAQTASEQHNHNNMLNVNINNNNMNLSTNSNSPFNTQINVVGIHTNKKVMQLHTPINNNHLYKTSNYYNNY